MKRNAVLRLCLALALTPRWAWADSLPDVLARVRAATGHASVARSADGWEMRGTARFSGLDERYSLRFMPSGAFRETYQGRLNQTTGFDGKTAWRVDYSGMPRILELQDRETALLVAEALTGRWLAGNSGMDAAVDGEQPDPTQVRLLFRLKGGVLPARLTVSRADWLPQSLTYTTPDGPEVWAFSDYRREHGRAYAHRLTHEVNGLKDVVTVRSLRPAAPAPALFAPVTRRPNDTRFAPNIPPQVPLLRTRTGHLLVRPRLDGRDVGWFILDSGAGVMVIDPGAAAALRLPSFGHQANSGAGAALQTSFCRGRTFALGPLTLDRPLYVQIDLSAATKAFHVPAAGVCGYDLFSRAVLEVDQGRRHLALRDPRRYRLTRGRWEPFRLDGGVACVRCRFEGNREGLFSLDTGSNGTVDFLALAVERLGLLKGRATAAVQGRGVGGVFQKRRGRLGWFEIGGHRFQNPEADFVLTKQGDLSGLYETGNVGGKFLDPFTLVFDYAHHRIAFVQK